MAAMGKKVVKRKLGAAKNDKSSATSLEKKISRKRRRLEDAEVSSDEDILSDDGRVVEPSDEELDDIDDPKKREFLAAQALLQRLGANKDLLQQGEHDEDADDAIAAELRDQSTDKAFARIRPIASTLEICEREEDDGAASLGHGRHRLAPTAVAISPTSAHVFSVGKDSTLVKYDCDAKRVVASVAYGRKSKVEKQRSKNKSKEAIEEERKKQMHHGAVYAVAVSPGGEYVVTGGDDHSIKVWSASDLSLVRHLKGHQGVVTGLAFRFRSNQLFSCGKDRAVKQWDLDQMGYLDTLFGHSAPITSIAVLDAERPITTGGCDRSVLLWKIERSSHMVFNVPQSAVSVESLAMLDDDHFVTGNQDGSIHVWSSKKKKPVYVRQNAHTAPEISKDATTVSSLSAVPYSDVVASGAADGRIRIWQVSADFKSLVLLYAYDVDGFINGLAFSRCGTLLAIAAGQEPSFGRWWVNKTARNRVDVIRLAYKQAAGSVVRTSRPQAGKDDDDDDDDE